MSRKMLGFVATIAVVALFLTGCSVGGTAAPTPTPINVDNIVARVVAAIPTSEKVDTSKIVSELAKELTKPTSTPTATPTPNEIQALGTQVARLSAGTAPAGTTGTPIVVAGSTPKATVAAGKVVTNAVTTETCTEQMLGPWQPPQDKPTYDYVQVNVEFPDSDYLVSLSYQRGISLSGWLVQTGDGSTTEVVYTVRTSIKEVQFAQPRSGVAWRLCGHPDVQLAHEVKDHATRIAADRTWLRVYNVGDLALSLKTNDAELKKLIKCVSPAMGGLPDCHTK